MAQLIDSLNNYKDTILQRTMAQQKEADYNNRLNNYNDKMATPIQIPETINLGDVASSFEGNGSLLSKVINTLGQAGKYVQTKQGNNILAGISAIAKNGMAAKLYSDMANQAGDKEAGVVGAAQKAEQDRLAQEGTDLRAEQALRSGQIISGNQLDLEKQKMEQEKALKEQELGSQASQRALEWDYKKQDLTNKTHEQKLALVKDMVKDLSPQEQSMALLDPEGAINGKYGQIVGNGVGGWSIGKWVGQPKSKFSNPNAKPNYTVKEIK